ncbi:hypothetical protein VMCG_08903 [Cytospora schulzeri]|uniref:Uncharacterized protein n=1 Tax=Cytospora schulzeri TaxID=448051 RepID=A0A423VUQ4_9PEZI|nr:hypothetical protein VMCG_08903 [Valsa malicola]
MNMLVQWRPQTRQTVIAFFDGSPSIQKRITSMFLRPGLVCLFDPSWFYTQVLTEFACLQEAALWTVRYEFREREKEPMQIRRPRPSYRRLPDIARHTVHVLESLDVAARTISGILLQSAADVGLKREEATE